MPEFAHPAWLALLPALPALVWLTLRGGDRHGRVRRVVAGVLRTLALAALVVAVAGPLAGTYSRHTDVVFALDVSTSVAGEPVARALDLVNRAFAAKAPGARMGLVAFGADAQVEAMPSTDPQPVREITVDVARGGSDLARAIEVAVGAFPPGEHRRVVLLSDGRENLGDARAAAAVARSVGVEIYAVPLDKAPAGGEVYVRGINVPARVRVHEPFEVQVSVHGNEAGRARLVVLRDGVVLHDVEVDLRAGDNAFAFVEQASRAGLHEYEAVVNGVRDGEQENNRFQAFVEVLGAPKVLHAQGAGASGRQVAEALRAQGLIVDEVRASAFPATLHRLVDYDLVVLDDVSGFDLSLSKMEMIEEYVRDAGGGLVTLGGEHSYGAGGYFGTPVERALPVTMDVRSEVKIASLAVVFVLDRSGSMGSRSHGEEKITMAKSAALAAIDLLNPLDRVGVLAFDDEPEWIVPPTEVGDRAPIAQQLRTLGSGGSTDLFRALDEAHRVMREQPAKVKHLIVLSDGLAGRDASVDEFGVRVVADGITVSAVALGIDADQALMRELATLGRGRYYYTDDPRNIPRIFASETLVLARDLVVERETRPSLAYPGEMLAGFEAGAFPVLLGYQRTFAKPSAQVLLRAPDGDPLLSSWRHGLGKAVAFTSDLSGRWGREWLRWGQFSRFVAQLARWSMRRGGAETLAPEFRVQGQRAQLLVDVLDRDERFVNGLDMRASISDPQRDTRAIALEQIAPGRYRGEFDVPRSGRYYVNLSGARDGLQVGPRTFGLAVPYSAEYVDVGADPALLEAVASAGGRVLPLSVASLPEIVAPRAGAASERWRVWRPLLLAALVVLLFEVAVRRLPLPRFARPAGDAQAPDAATEALRRRYADDRERHLAALRDGAGGDGAQRRARLHVAGRTKAGRARPAADPGRPGAPRG